VLSTQCLDRRIGTKATLGVEVYAWENYRYKHNAKADWHFSNQTARVKLRHLYLAI